MSRIPSGLLYLAIYNPTLTPRHPVAEDDEDAEEQAHILFYTSKEKAVSRDRMLRQIGLAKALVNFAELFNPHDECESVHSQSRRMVLVSPEPNFWFNASVELPKSPQAPAASKHTSKGKPKTPKAPPPPEAIYDYDDGTVHDVALRQQILHAYERFKLSHGSFTSILAELGQEALELQLERFFTPWAWSWNLEAKPQIAEQLGTPLQPYYASLTPLVDAFSAHLPESVVPVVLSSTHIIPSTRYTSKAYPAALAELLMKLIPPPTSDPLASSVDTIHPPTSPEPGSDKSKSDGLFGLPTVNVNMGMGKWNWQSYLTFGKNSSAAQSRSESPEKRPVDVAKAEPGDALPKVEAGSVKSPSPTVEVQVDAKALKEALASDDLSIEVPDGDEGVGDEDEQSQSDSDGAPCQEVEEDSSDEEMDEGTLGRNNALQLELVSSSPKSSRTILPKPRAPSTRSPSPSLPEFSVRQLHLASSEDLVLTQKCDVHYYIRNDLMLAVISDPSLPGFTDVEEFLSVAAENANGLLDDIQHTIQSAALNRMSESLPTANKILQTPDRHAISTGQYLLQSPEFSSDSSHLHNAISLFDRDPDVLEVYSRGQNPQNWHIAKRGLANPLEHEDNPRAARRGMAFLEVFKKEASLPDVDNVLASIIKKSGVAESGLV